MQKHTNAAAAGTGYERQLYRADAYESATRVSQQFDRVEVLPGMP